MRTKLAIYLISLAVLLPITLHGGRFLTGTDIHFEYYLALKAMNGWNTAIANPVNSCLGITVLTPFLSKLLHLDIVWILKIVFPMIFATTPVILYSIYSKYLTKVESFIATMFFIAFPAFFVEIGGSITREQLASPFLALFLLAILSKWQTKYKFLAMLGSGLAVIFFHYSLGIVLVAIFFMYIVFMVLFRIFRRKGFTPVWVSVCVFAILLGTAFGYYGNVAGGTPLRYLTAIIPVKETKIGFLTIGWLASPVVEVPSETTQPVAKPLSNPNGWITGEKEPKVDMSVTGIVNSYDSLMQTALGLDFLKVSAVGKAFRIMQYITQILLAIGVIYFLVKFRRLKFNLEYLALSLVSVGLLLFCVIVPGFSSILNASRWYHIALFMLSPMIVIGMKAISGGYKVANTVPN